MAAAREKAKICAPCHGLDGLSKGMDAPNIAGQLEAYLVKQLKAFRAGERKQDQMSIIAQGLSDSDISNLAAYYAAIEVSVKVPK